MELADSSYSYTTLDDIIDPDAGNVALKAGAFTAGLGLLLATPAKYIAYSSLTFAGFAYGLSLMQNDSYISKIAGTVIAASLVVPAYLAVYTTAPRVIGQIYTGIQAFGARAYFSATRSLAAVGAGAYLGYSLAKGIYKGVKNVVGSIAKGIKSLFRR